MASRKLNLPLPNEETYRFYGFGTEDFSVMSFETTSLSLEAQSPIPEFGLVKKDAHDRRPRYMKPNTKSKNYIAQALFLVKWETFIMTLVQMICC
ncbi:hypothetical protein CEXT_234021 [Caerostris extrusa]|uniref:Uncharacterized protein n=1 Tax=Caerostris extrusa TaxID=172846 RepID=A0AAV4X216_CAEEX|nr:hypothetical protein CEXT_234021 [Caerostris extrusa]